jgi:hypothetical protein
MRIVPGSRSRRARRSGAGISLLLAVLALLCAVPAAAAQPTLAVSVGAVAPGSIAIGPGFIGLSFEDSALPRLARNVARGNLVGLLTSLGPGVARFGGISADLDTTFLSRPKPRPARARAALAPTDFLTPATITPDDFDRLGALLRAADWTALLTVPLGRFDPGAAARAAQAASRGLGRRLLAIEAGNEPNAYPLIGLRLPSWSYPQYLAQFEAYARAISVAAPAVRIAGPDTALGDLGWLTAFAHDARPTILTPHFYALSACNKPPPTLDDLLAPGLAESQGRTLAMFGMIGHDARIPLRLDEANNIGCEGQAGVSNTFGAALWAVRLMLGAARAGIAGINLHTLPESCYGRYSPFCAPTAAGYAAGRFRAMPEWYALLFIHLLVGEQPLSTSVPGEHPGLTVDALSSRSRRRIDFALVNTTATPSPAYTVRLPSLGCRSATTLWLTAAALNATSGVALGGAAVRPDGTWQPHAPMRSITGPRLTIPPASAVLVRLSGCVQRRSRR